MKKLLAFILVCATYVGVAQTNYVVTFKVNTANITVGSNGLYLGGGVIGGANAVQLTDADGNGVYEGTDTLSGAGGGNFIFLNSPAHSNDWGTKENLAGLSCADASNYNDRILPSFSQDTTLLFCFGTCATDTVCPVQPTNSDVTFSVDMNDVTSSFTNVYVSGTMNSWGGTSNQLTDPDGDGVYEGDISLAAGNYEFKFTYDNWTGQESLNPATTDSVCTLTTGVFTNRYITVGSADTTLPVYCWEECFACSPSFPDVVAINTFNSMDASGVVDSLGAMKWIKVIVTSIDFDGNAGYSFYGEDATDGINIYNFADKSGYTTPTMGDSLYIYGEVEQYRGLTELKPDSIYLLNQGNTLPAPSIETSLDESTESELIKLVGFTVVDPTQWPSSGSSANVDITNGTDTLTMRIDSDTDIDGSPAPAVTFDVTGIGSQFDFSSPYTEGYQIFPRKLTDIRISFPDVVAINTFNSMDANGVVDSLGAMKWIKVIVTSIDFDGNAGYSFYGEDATDGINIYNFADKSGYTTPTMGDSLYIYGEVEQYRGLTELKPDSIYLLNQGNALPAPSIETSLDESTESELIKLVGFTLVNSSQWPGLGSSGNVDITNGTDTLRMRIDSDAGISPYAPTDTFDVTGIGSQYDFSSPFDEGYQILPRMAADVFDYSPLPNITIQIDLNSVSALPSTAMVLVDILHPNTLGYSPKLMTDSNNDGIYEVTFQDPMFQNGGDQYRFRYVSNGQNYEPLDLSTSDSLCAEQGVGAFTGTVVREYSIGSTDTIFPVVCWGECSACVQSGCDELFFSEYGEGSSQNKYYEIYNPTGAAIDLSNYEVKLYSNGGTTASQTLDFPTGTMLASGDVYVVANSSSDASILAFSDTTSTTTYFNGNDALALFKNSDTLDILGEVGVSSYWTVGTGSMSNNTLVRKATVNNGTSDWTQSSSEWDVYASNTWSYGGAHTSNCFNVAPPPSFPDVVAINTFNSMDASGVVDSLGAMKWIKVIVTSIDFDGNAGYSFYGEDATDGINIYNFVDKSGYTTPTMGDSLYIYGEVEQFRGLTELKPDSIYLLNQGNTLPTPSIETSLDESTESELIQLIGFNLVDPTQWPSTGSSANVDITNGTDTLTMRIDSDTDIDGSPAPAGTFDVTGLGSQYDSSSPYDEGYQILPRMLTDIFEYPFIPTYTIGQVDGVDSDGLPDSLSVYCKVEGIVMGVDMQGSATAVSFTVHDGTDGMGTYSSAPAAAAYNVTEGDEVRIIGTIGHFNGLLQMVLDSVVVLSTGNTLQSPTVVTSLGENTESELIKFENATMVDPTQWGSGSSGYTIDITNGTDTVIMRIDADVDLYGTTAPTGAFDVVGIGGQYDWSAPHTSGYQILPRYIADITPAAAVYVPEIVVSEIMAGSNSTAYNADWFEIYNYGDTVVNIGGFSWDDESDISGTSVFPSVTISPGEAIVVLDDVSTNKDAFLAEWKLYPGSVTIVANDELTGSFPSLSQNGDGVYLYDATGTALTNSLYSAATAGYSVEFDTTGAFTGNAVDGTNGAYTSLEGDVGSPGNLTPNSNVNEQSIIRKIYPNPTTGMFTVELGVEIEYTVQIVNMLGETIAVEQGVGNAVRMDLNAAAGTYLAKVVTERGTQTLSVVLQ